MYTLLAIQCSKCKLHGVTCKVNEPKGVHVNFPTNPTNVVYTSINIWKIRFIAYINIHFNQELDEKSYLSTETEAVKHLHTVFLLTVEQR